PPPTSARTPASSRSPTRSTPRSTSETASRSSAAARGRRARSRSATRSATGICPSAVRSSLASAVPPTAEASVPGSLHSALVALPVVIESVGCAVREVPLGSYPGRVRPTSTVRLGEGRGEHVGWTAAAHESFRARLDAVPRGRWRIGAWAAAMKVRFPDPYDRAALEAAAIDLALRQRSTDLGGLVAVDPRAVRYVVSFEAVADPIARAGAEGPDVELKIDVDASWNDGTWERLAALGRVAILDFKERGGLDDHERAHGALPHALLEDPGGTGGWSASVRT